MQQETVYNRLEPVGSAYIYMYSVKYGPTCIVLVQARPYNRSQQEDGTVCFNPNVNMQRSISEPLN